MEPPKTLKNSRGFIGAVNYYQDMYVATAVSCSSAFYSPSKVN
ncbi:hypothetical protein ACHAWF_014578 [Thalassiosira exigua]